MMDHAAGPSTRDRIIFGMLWIAFLPMIGWILTGIGDGLLLLAGVAAACLALALMLDREHPRRHLISGVLIPVTLVGIWAVLRATSSGADASIRGVRGAVLAAFILIGLVGGAGAVISSGFGGFLYRWWMRSFSPIAWTISHLLMSVTFFGVITPIGLGLRLFRKDLLGLRSSPDETTCWNERRGTRDDRSYLRQY